MRGTASGTSKTDAPSTSGTTASTAIEEPEVEEFSDIALEVLAEMAKPKVQVPPDRLIPAYFTGASPKKAAQ